MHELLKLSALELAEKIAQKKISPSEVLEAHIEQIEKVNSDLNAMVEFDFERARSLAKKQTEQIASGEINKLPPLFGVPFTVKEMFSYEGMKRTAGSVHRKNDTSDWDATVVARLKKAGAIPMGTTNVPELGFWYETNNNVYGRTNNPYDLKRTCGGSSGGEGALIGAGASPIGLGSDIGGSIRMPASFCGVFGHKPSRYLLPLTGHFPFSKEDFVKLLREGKYPYTSMGPLSRKASDLYTLTEILMGSDNIDQMTMKHPVLKPKVSDWSKVKVFTMPDPIFHGASRTSDELQQSVRNVGNLFSELGVQVEELDSRFFIKAVSLWFAAVGSTKTKDFHEILKGSASSFSVAKELFKIAIGKPDYIFPNLIVSLGEILDPRKQTFEKELAALEELRLAFEQKLGPNGILILPPHPRVAPKHRFPYLTPMDFIYTGIFNVLGVPATSVPTGLNAEGLPLGVQVIAGHMNDHLTLSCAELLESTFGGWIPPERYA